MQRVRSRGGRRHRARATRARHDRRCRQRRGHDGRRGQRRGRFGAETGLGARGAGGRERRRGCERDRRCRRRRDAGRGRRRCGREALRGGADGGRGSTRRRARLDGHRPLFDRDIVRTERRRRDTGRCRRRRARDRIGRADLGRHLAERAVLRAQAWWRARCPERMRAAAARVARARRAERQRAAARAEPARCPGARLASSSPGSGEMACRQVSVQARGLLRRPARSACRSWSSERPAPVSRLFVRRAPASRRGAPSASVRAATSSTGRQTSSGLVSRRALQPASRHQRQTRTSWQPAASRRAKPLASFHRSRTRTWRARSLRPVSSRPTRMRTWPPASSQQAMPLVSWHPKRMRTS